jgi:hypothetical protein
MTSTPTRVKAEALDITISPEEQDALAAALVELLDQRSENVVVKICSLLSVAVHLMAEVSETEDEASDQAQSMGEQMITAARVAWLYQNGEGARIQ